jgi:hypothetical protein
MYNWIATSLTVSLAPNRAFIVFCGCKQLTDCHQLVFKQAAKDDTNLWRFFVVYSVLVAKTKHKKTIFKHFV